MVVGHRPENYLCEQHHVAQGHGKRDEVGHQVRDGAAWEEMQIRKLRNNPIKTTGQKI